MAERTTISLGELNELPGREVGPMLASCCGSRRWVAQMLDRRPFEDTETMLNTAEDVWWSLGPDDWREAFEHHPRIGERDTSVAQEERARAWSAGEQRGVAEANPEILAALVEANREYERRFGHIYLVSAVGKSAPQLLAILRARLSNDADTELGVAAGEQAKITRLRLLKLVGLSDADVVAPRAARRESLDT